MVTFTVSSSTEAPLRLKTPIQESFELHDHTSATLLFVSCGERAEEMCFPHFISFVVLLISKQLCPQDTSVLCLQFDITRLILSGQGGQFAFRSWLNL